MNDTSQVVYCRCAFAEVVSKDVKDDVLKRLVESGTSFDMVSDLCEMSARKDERLKNLVKCTQNQGAKIIACYPRAVKGLFHNAGQDLAEDVEILNMREETAESVVDKVLNDVSEEVV